MFDPHIKGGNQMFVDVFNLHAHEVFTFDYWYEVLQYDDGAGNLLDQIAPRVFVQMKR